MQSNVLQRVIKNLSHYSVEALKIISEKDSVRLEELRDCDGLDILLNYILNDQFISFYSLLENHYQLNSLLTISEETNLFRHKFYNEFATANKVSISNDLMCPITPEMTSAHVLVCLLFKNTIQLKSSFKSASLNKTLKVSIEKMIEFDSNLLSYTDSCGYTVGDYMLLFPSVESLSILLERDKSLQSVVNVPISKIKNLLEEYCTESLEDNKANAVREMASLSNREFGHLELLSKDKFQIILDWIDPLILEEELSKQSPINANQKTTSLNISKF